MRKKTTLSILANFIFALATFSQITYEFPENKRLAFGTYGRIGVDWSFENNSSVGRRLNLNNMGSVGGRLEEQDYLEMAAASAFLSSKEIDSSFVYFQTRFAFYSRSSSLFGNSTSTSLGGLTFALPELFIEAKNINGSGVNLWVGSRLYRGPDVHIADYRYFNDHSGQGFGFEYKNTRFVGLFIASTDTASTLPPYFYLNIASGTPSAALRQRTSWSIEQDFFPDKNQKITLLGEY